VVGFISKRAEKEAGDHTGRDYLILGKEPEEARHDWRLNSIFVGQGRGTMSSCCVYFEGKPKSRHSGVTVLIWKEELLKTPIDLCCSNFGDAATEPCMSGQRIWRREKRGRRP
jgi:hypothetical protein